MARPPLKPIVERNVWTRDPRFVRVVTSDPEGGTQYVRYEARAPGAAISQRPSRLLTAVTYLSLCANLGMLLLYVNRLV